MAGITSGRHVGLTYNDGPDPASTPQFLELLGRYDVTATFFLLGRRLAGNGSLVQDMAAAGHDLAVHGWDHTCLARKRPGLITDELKRTRHTIEDLTGQPVTWYRPPYGLITGEGALAARRAQLRTVLWSASGRDRNPQATTLSIVQNVSRTLRPGGTVLLHDANHPSEVGSRQASLNATDALLNTWAAQHIPVSSLSDRMTDPPDRHPRTTSPDGPGCER